MRFNFNLTIGKFKKQKLFGINFFDLTDQVDIDLIIESFKQAYFSAFQYEGKIQIACGEEIDLNMKISLAQIPILGGEEKIKETISILNETIKILSETIFEQSNLDLTFV